MSIGDLMTIDVHAHLSLASIDAAIADQPLLAAQRALDFRRSGDASAAVSLDAVRAVIPQLTQLAPRLADMDAAGVAVQVVSPSPLQYHYWADEPMARTIWRLANEGIAAFCSLAPDRFVGLGLAPLQHGTQAVEALNHAVVACGLRGVEISSNAARLDGSPVIDLSADHLEPFWARAAALGAVIFVHPMGCTLDDRLDQWYLSNLVGQPAENAVALSHLIFSGVLDRHPDLRIIAAHGGGYLPTYLGRADHGWLNRRDCRTCADRPSSYMQRLWFDSLVFEPAALRALVAVAGAERVMIGSDYPFDMGVRDPVQRLLTADLGDTATRMIARGNAETLGLVP